MVFLHVTFGVLLTAYFFVLGLGLVSSFRVPLGLVSHCDACVTWVVF